MIGVPSGVRIWLCTAPTDMRCGVDGLAVLAVDQKRVIPGIGGFLYS